MHATIFLRTALFTWSRGNTGGHAPANTAAIEGEVAHDNGGVRVLTQRFLDGSGKPLEASQVTLFLPWSKIDHLWVHEAS